MTFYVVHKLKVKNPQSLTEGQASESVKLFKTAKAQLFHRIAANFRNQIDEALSIGDLVGDSDSDKQHWLLCFDISSKRENEAEIFGRLDWVDHHIVDIVSSLQDVVFEPRLDSSWRMEKNASNELEQSFKDNLVQQVHEFILGYLAGHNYIKLTGFSGLVRQSGLTIHRAEQLSGLKDTTQIFTFKGRVTDYDANQKTIKALRNGSSNHKNEAGENFLDDGFDESVDGTSLADRSAEKDKPEAEFREIQKPREEIFHVNTSEFVSIEHQAKYMPWERRFNREIEFNYQILDGRRHICLRMDSELHTSKIQI